jgi:hypothetical protein
MGRPSRSCTAAVAVDGTPDPPLLAAQLQLIYDGGASAANLDRDPSIAGPARAAAAVLVAASLERRSLARAS